jgi:hypothetical protein
MPAQDRYGLTLTTNADEAASAYRDGMDLLLSAWPGAATAFERAVTADPDFAGIYCARPHPRGLRRGASRPGDGRQSPQPCRPPREPA